MNVLVVGSGAREHAIAWKLRQSARLTDLFVAPGNAGTAAIATNLPIKANELEGILASTKEHRIDLVVVGPEDPLARGLVDRLNAGGIAAFGPSQAAARIEYSKVFSKRLLLHHGIPTAQAAVFDNRHDARAYAQSLGGPSVVKADGLAAGKGVIVCDSPDDAIEAVDRLMGEGSSFGEAGRSVLIEERLTGREVSAHAFTDGKTVVPMPFACDYKRIGDGDEGPNTGGIGAYTPALWLDEPTERFIHQNITEAAIAAMASEGIPYKGALYPGLMITSDGPRVIEFNSRFGDPEAEVILPRLESDLLEICWAVANDRLHQVSVEWSTNACVAVFLSSGGYPGEYETGFPIAGLASLEPEILAFHAGTALSENGETVTSGGRVLAIVACAATVQEARARAYRNVQRVHFSRAYYRHDIAAPAQEARVD
jgi:phosphoribosylamine--glycine ligase